MSSVYRSSVFSVPSGGAALWVHWRKSSVSKQLLGLMRAVIEVVEADEGTVNPTLEFLVARANVYATLHGCIAQLTQLFAATQSAALWPAMREWIIDQGGMNSVWAALARSMELAAQERVAFLALCGADAQMSAGAGKEMSESLEDLSYRPPRMNIVSALTMTNQLPIATPASWPEELPFLPGLIASLSFLFSEVLPRDMAAGNAHKWDLILLVYHIVMLWHRCRSVGGIPPSPFARELIFCLTVGRLGALII